MRKGSPEIKKPKKGSTDKTPRERLALLVYGFMEKEIEREDLISHPDKIDYYRGLLEENLWEQKIDAHDSSWNFDSDLSDIAIDNPNLYPPGEVTRANLEQGVNTILYFHGLLKPFWDDFKEHLEVFRRVTEDRESIKALSDAQKRLKGSNLEGLGQDLLDDTHREREYSQEIQSPITLGINYSFESGRVRFFYSGVDAVRALVDLLKDIPIGDFRKCKDEKGCGKWFVMTSKRKRDFCSHLCAARYIERIKRDKFPKAFLQYHQEYYDKHLKRKKKDETNVTEVT